MAVLAVLAKKVWCSRRLLVLLLAPLLLLPVVFSLPPQVMPLQPTDHRWPADRLPGSATRRTPLPQLRHRRELRS